MSRQPSLTTRILHAGLAAGVTVQLLVSLFMQRPGHHGEALTPTQAGGFEVHQTVGLLLLPLTVAWFAWLFARTRESGPRSLFPWFSHTQRRALFAATRNALASGLHLRMPALSDTEVIAPAVHGLGALCALFMALSGTLVWLGMSEQGQLTGWAHDILELHEAASNLMWAYLVGHTLMALLHQFNGESAIGRMLSLRRTERVTGR
jgi:cytochrome b561